jgi:hypothetical protein
MKKFYGILPVVLMAAIAWASDAPTQPNENAQPENRDQNQAEQSKAPKQATLTYRQRMITGKVADMKEADVATEGKTENHFLAKVNTHDNRVVVVDLGPRSGLKAEIKPGDEIAAFGITGRLNQRPLIVASKVATIVPIEGREEIYESIPASYERSEGATPNERFAEEALRKSNEKSAEFSRTSSNAPPSFQTECDNR